MPKCSLCSGPLGEDQDEVTSDSGLVFHRTCLENMVGKKSKPTDQKQDIGYSALEARKTKDRFDPTPPSPGNEQDWECQYCSMSNITSTKRCETCGKSRFLRSSSINDTTEEPNIEETYGHSPLSSYNAPQQNQGYVFQKSKTKDTPTAESYHGKYTGGSLSTKSDCRQYQMKDDSDESQDKDRIHPSDYDRPSSRRLKITPLKHTTESATVRSPPSSSPRIHVVYITNLPLDMDDNLELEGLVRRRIEDILQTKVDKVKCYSKLGVGVIYVKEDEQKSRLTEKIGQIALYPKDGNHFISFVEAIELISFIALDVSEDRKDDALPTTKEIARRWTELHKGDKPSTCETLNAHFPNIFRIVSTSLDKIVSAPSQNAFSIKTFLAHVHYCADCSFFEDLPRTATQQKLRDTIWAAIGKTDLSPVSLYIQVNKQAASACIIVTDKARAWSTESYMTIEKNPFPKKNRLSCRLLLHPIPKTLSIQSILNHRELKDIVASHKQSGEQLMLEITDKEVFHSLINRGALRIDANHSVHVDLCNNLSNPDEKEVDADTWYEIEMPQEPPDIMRFVVEPNHSIFRFQWNQDIWLEQFKRVANQKRDNNRNVPHDVKNPTPDQTRHLLRVTVMLNTLGVMRKKSFMIGNQQVKLNLKLELKTIMYDHESKLERSDRMPLSSPPYSQTTVHVDRQDCLVVYENMVKSGKRPLLLNMASATSPGGGFRKGDGAQEENIFRRSDYCRSLDIGLDEFLHERAERLHCSSNGTLEPISSKKKMYPMDEYGAIYTAGITVFRQSEESGYAFMKTPLEDVCAIAMAAYRDPELQGDILAPKYAVGTRKKIENIFSIAYHHKHDSLVLSALGCGAFKNPPDHIAKLFLSVIEQYAGFFKSIVFAIVDDHNAGRHLNPEGNFQPFAKVLGDVMSVQPIMPMNKPNTMFGPYRLLSDGSTVSDIAICDLPPCKFGSKCNDIYNPNHTSKFSHPPLCAQAVITGTCKSTGDVVHMSSFIHRKQCRNGGLCPQMSDETHNREFEHPDFCSERGKCRNQQADHMQQYRHLPLCPNSHKCIDFQKNVIEHCNTFRHCAPQCPHGYSCAMFHDKKHLADFQHPFAPPCPRTPFDCSQYRQLAESKDTRTLPTEVQQHCLDFSHVCIFGRECTDQTALHWSKCIHIARFMCPHQKKCNKLNDEEHVNSFTHPDILDIRPPCPYHYKCRDRHKPDHRKNVRHPTFDEDVVVQYYGSNENTNFIHNQKNNVLGVTDFVARNNWIPLPSGGIPNEIVNWIRTVQPLHRCSPIIFESILLHGHVMSREYMEHLKEPKFIVKSVLQHPRVRRIDALKIKTCEDDAEKYVDALVNLEFEKKGFSPGIPGSAAATPHPVYSKSEEYSHTIKRKETKLLTNMHKNDLTALRTKAIEIAQASIKLHSDPAGIGHPPDKLLGTDKLVFSILGPHLGHYYGDVIIIFKREILHHPDANFSMQAATSFASGNAYNWRPWLGTDPGNVDERVKHYHRTKLHAAVPGYDRAAALELIALTGMQLKRKSMDVDLQQILDNWMRTDSHHNIEGHLPQLIPLDYIDHIYIPKNLYDGFNENAKKAIDAVFKHCITVAPYIGEASHDRTTFGPIPKMKSRADYQKFVIDDLMARYKKNAAQLSTRGFVMAIGASSFDDNYVIPLTISQAYTQYRLEHTNPSKDNIIYIYWKALNGDMMLTLSNTEIDPSQSQPNLRCLLCYVAPKSTMADNNYYEHTSYITSGHPFQHDTILSRKTYSAKSNTFYLACDTNDYITYCLQLHRSSGKVILSHAGPNAIYNHEEVSCTFNKTELDLSRLEVIHVSAGTHTVPMRNLIICFEKNLDLHPTFDKNFKKDISFDAANRPPAGHTPVNRSHEREAHHGSSPKASEDDASKPIGFLGHMKKLFVGDHGSVAKPCPDNVNCLKQYSKDSAAHNAEYTHPCRYSELCRDKEAHLTHDPHLVPTCAYGKKCNKLTDVAHRASNRHAEQPDFLIPCRDQKKCPVHTTIHRMKYSHGEEVFGKVAKTPSAAAAASHPSHHGHRDQDDKTPCRHGSNCYIDDEFHRAVYSHPSPSKPKDDDRTPCKWGFACHDSGAQHRAQFSHPRK